MSRILAVLVGFSCAFAMPAQGQKGKKGADKPLTNEEVRIRSLYLDAAKQRMLGNNEEAAQLYFECLKADPNNTGALYEMALMAAELDHKDEALLMAEKAYALDSKNRWFALTAAELNMDLNKAERAEKILLSISAIISNDPDLIYALANTQLLNGKPKKALETLDLMDKSIGKTPEISEQKVNIYLQMNDLESAIAERKAMISQEPMEFSYTIALIELLLVNGRTDEALAVLTPVLNANLENGELNLCMAEIYRFRKEKEKSFYHLEQAFRDTEVDIDKKIKVMLSLLSLADRDSTLISRGKVLIARLEQAHPGSAKTFAIKGDLLSRAGDKLGARAAFKRTVEIDSSRFPVWAELLRLDVEIGDNSALLKDATTALELFPDKGATYTYLGLARSRAGDYKLAAEVLRTGEMYARNDPSTHVQLLSLLASALVEIGETNEADRAFEKALQLDPLNPSILNNYAYALCERNQRLEKAEEMSASANRTVPNNAFYLDTYARILYRLNRLDEALKWINKALEAGGTTMGVVVEHQGDILMKAGNEKAAKEAWLKAKALGGTTSGLDQKINSVR